MGIGEWAALGAAILWTFSSLLWGRVQLTAVGINLSKNYFACIFIAIQVLVVFLVTENFQLTATPQAWGWLALSGIVGIVIGDTFFFRSLQILGPRRALMMATTSPLFTAVLGWLFLHESLRLFAMIGIVITVLGVVVVVADRRARSESPGLFPGDSKYGIAFGCLGAFCQASGAVLARKGLAESEALESTFIRLFVAGIAMTVVVLCQRKFREIIKKAINWTVLKFLVPATAIGTWMGIWLSQISNKESSSAAIAVTLMSTCPIFAIPVIWIFNGHRASWLAMAGSLVAIVGITMAVSRPEDTELWMNGLQSWLK